MPPRREWASPVSPLYVRLGPQPASALRHAVEEEGLTGEEAQRRAAEILAEHKAWREQYLDAWERGERVPEPPYADQLDCFARPAA